MRIPRPSFPDPRRSGRLRSPFGATVTRALRASSPDPAPNLTEAIRAWSSSGVDSVEVRLAKDGFDLLATLPDTLRAALARLEARVAEIRTSGSQS